MTNAVKELAERERLIKAPLSMAKDDRERLVPIVGAGISLPLGLPGWQQFLAILSEQAGLDPINSGDPPDVLEEIKQKMGETAFIAAIQHLLSLPSDSTTATLQALVNAPIRRIITTNLDLAIETAFTKAQKPLNPSNVGRGHFAEELSLFDRPPTDTVLLKIHGSIERPSTWVLTRQDYDAAYIDPGRLRDFLSKKIPIPLFVGFSFSDFDINESLRIAKLTQRKKAYTIIHIEQAKSLERKFKALGIIPIGFFKYDQIPEIIDEIFRCSPLTVKIETPWKAPPAKLHIGGAEINIPPNISKDEKRLEKVVHVLANAFEFQPNRSIITEQYRRNHGQKGKYREDVIRILRDKETSVLKTLFKGFVQYPDIFFGLTNSILRKEEVEHFYFFKIFFDCFPHSHKAERMERVVLDNLHNPDLTYKCLRAVAKIAAIRGKHPALRIPPPTVIIGRFIVPIYLLTRYQVGLLMGRNPPEIEHPLRPYTIQSLEEVPKILKRLSEETNQEWRLPSAKEWLFIAGVENASNPWPWGNDDPQYKIHAHLRYVLQGGNVASHPLEVGIFPKGKSPTGLFDLIGNTYELVIGDNGWYHLAGGAWTTSFKPGSNFRLIRGWSRGKENIGLRPICEI